MKNRIQFTLVLTIMLNLLFFSCTTENQEDTNCNCEEAIYIEEKYQSDDGTWLLNRVEMSRQDINCQDETDFLRTGNGTEVRRIECQ